MDSGEGKSTEAPPRGEPKEESCLPRVMRGLKQAVEECEKGLCRDPASKSQWIIYGEREGNDAGMMPPLPKASRRTGGRRRAPRGGRGTSG